MKTGLRSVLVLLCIVTAARCSAEVLIDLDKDLYSRGEVVKATVSGVPRNEMALIRWVDSRGNVQRQLFARGGGQRSISADFLLETPTTVYNEIIVRVVGQKEPTETIKPFKIIMPVQGWLDYYPIAEFGEKMPAKAVMDAMRAMGVGHALCRERKRADLLSKESLRLLYLYALEPRDFYPQEEDYKALIESYASAPSMELLRRNPALDAQRLTILRVKVARMIDRDAVNRPFGFFIGEDLFLAPGAAHVDYDMSPEALEAFRGTLRNSYASIHMLNRAWETDFRRWENVVPMTAPEIVKREQARRRPSLNCAPFIEFRMYMEDEFSKFLAGLVGAIRSDSQGTPVGIVGGWMPTVYGG